MLSSRIWKHKKAYPEGIRVSSFERVLFLLSNPSWIKFIQKWNQSLKREVNSLQLEIPWFTYRAIEWLEDYVKPDMSVFEYGSGGSTIFLAKRVKRLISVEHERGWLNLVQNDLFKRDPQNCELILAEPEKTNFKIPYSYRSYTSITFEELEGLTFKKYVSIIDRYADFSFDLVVIDGRARVSCIFHAIRKVKNRGYILLDNSERPQYEEGIRLLSEFKRRDFFGFGPCLKTFWQTSVWEIRKT